MLRVVGMAAGILKTENGNKRLLMGTEKQRADYFFLISIFRSGLYNCSLFAENVYNAVNSRRKRVNLI